MKRLREITEQLSVSVPNSNPFSMKETDPKYFNHLTFTGKAFRVLRNHPSLSPITRFAVKQHIKHNPNRSPLRFIEKKNANS